MTPARGDHDARRTEVSEAVWQVLAERGFGGLTLRAVAARMGASTGLLTHYFPNKRALVAYALDVLEKRSAQRPRPAAEAVAEVLGAAAGGAAGAAGVAGMGGRGGGAGRAMLRATLLDILPLTPAGVAGNRIWVGSWDVALADPDLAAEHAARYRRSRERIAELVTAAQRAGELPAERSAEELAAAAQSFVLGLVVQALFAPTEFSPQRQTDLLDAYLDAI
ncbi:TetR/AcrR family transcriptional regulator [Kitasatospora sp. MAP5-34]|uniref:TetR/AcrR family transcriptional regulator n=1 Tax=Kitasatospora sp. MAP5-34 TaxID=3035102 RepID=UPI0024768B9E|nr:TetR/AcrR family transcriptional regulator [Kitasatospora sp. MAP5-34]MDH6578312.1 AcrR family transcriptional regulator [Kitasatospora sp. MAP5-34]